MNFQAQRYNDLQYLFWSLNRIELVLPANGVGSFDWHPFISPCETYRFNNRKSNLVYKYFNRSHHENHKYLLIEHFMPQEGLVLKDVLRT